MDENKPNHQCRNKSFKHQLTVWEWAHQGIVRCETVSSFWNSGNTWWYESCTCVYKSEHWLVTHSSHCWLTCAVFGCQAKQREASHGDAVSDSTRLARLSTPTPPWQAPLKSSAEDRMKPSCWFLHPLPLPLMTGRFVWFSLVVMGTLQIRAAGPNVDIRVWIFIGCVHFAQKADSSLFWWRSRTWSLKLQTCYYWSLSHRF